MELGVRSWLNHEKDSLGLQIPNQESNSNTYTAFNLSLPVLLFCLRLGKLGASNLDDLMEATANNSKEVL